jgi:WD40 repeat protein
LARLLEKELDYLQSQPPEPPAPERTLKESYQREVDNDSVNHALAWLAVAIDEQLLLQRYGNRLIKLRDAAKGHWKAELQLALDEAHVEDNLELITLAQSEQAHSLHSQPRVYHPGGTTAIAFSGDGKFLATGGEWRDICVWNTGDWTCAKMIEQEGEIRQLSFSPDCKFLAATSADGANLTEHRFDWRSATAVTPPGKPGKEDLEDPQYRADSLLTPDGTYRITAGGKHAQDDFIQLQVLRASGASQAVAEVRFPRGRGDWPKLAVSPDGGQVAIASGDVRLGIYRLPDLKVIKEYHFPCRWQQSERISALVYSPDGKWLAAAQRRRPTPRLFRPENGEEVMPYEGHGDQPVDLRFLPDGKTLRSIGDDAAVCTWDAATLKMLRRSSLAAGRLAASVRPTDGRYVLCPLTRDPTEPIEVIDVETGKALCEVKLPVMWDHFAASNYHLASAGKTYWLNDQEALCTGVFLRDNTGRGFNWWRFNYRTGTVVDEGSGNNDMQNSVWFRTPELMEDGKHLFLVDGRGKGTWGTLKGESIDTATMILQTLDEVKVDREPNGDFGLVPGGKYFHIGSHIFDRQTLKLVAARDFPRYDLKKIAFSPDGARYAAVLTKSPSHNEWYGIDAWSWYAKYPSVVRVHETLSGKTLLAYSPSAAVYQLAFSPDGQRLATANADGAIEVRDIPPSTAQ